MSNNFWVWKRFGSNKILVQKKDLGPKTFEDQKNLRYKKICGLKQFFFGVKKIFGLKKFVVQIFFSEGGAEINFGSKINLGFLTLKLYPILCSSSKIYLKSQFQPIL